VYAGILRSTLNQIYCSHVDFVLNFDQVSCHGLFFGQFFAMVMDYLHGQFFAILSDRTTLFSG
jgi:hypothetical protein